MLRNALTAWKTASKVRYIVGPDVRVQVEAHVQNRLRPYGGKRGGLEVSQNESQLRLLDTSAVPR